MRACLLDVLLKGFAQPFGGGAARELRKRLDESLFLVDRPSNSL